MYYARQKQWLQLAEQLKPRLNRQEVLPIAQVRAVKDRSAFQGWRMEKAGRVASLRGRTLRRGDHFVLDFGQHIVGYLSFHASADGPQDAPVRLKFTFAEVPAETAEAFDPHRASLSRAWMQDETLNLDTLPALVRLPRRYAFRYVKVEVIDTSTCFGVRLFDFSCVTVTAAGRCRPAKNVPKSVQRLDEVGLRTLANCMHTVFEDGPKRDRRLWLGDLRLQALANYESFHSYDLVKRCLYLFAGLARTDGTVWSCEYEVPDPHAGHCFILDYTALFVPTLLEYTRASGDRATARELWPVALRQMEFVLRYVDRDGVFRDPKRFWLFIDWSATLDKQTSMQGIFIYCLRRLEELAQLVGREDEAAPLCARLPKMAAGARRKLWDDQRGVFVSGPARQVSWASQAWMALSGVMAPEEGAEVFRTLPKMKGVVKPAGPYLYHYVVEALLKCGMEREAVRLLRSYWGGMVDRGASTFWEVYDPADETLSPYQSHLMNSYCHAWSCTPTYFIRKWPQVFRRLTK